MKITRAEARKLGLDLPETASKTARAYNEDNGHRCPPVADGRALAFEALCLAHGLPLPVTEYRFHPTRRWRFDYLWDGWLALEVEGGVHTQGRHTRGSGFLGDMAKYNEAAIMGFVVLRCTPEDVQTGAAFALVKRALVGEAQQP